MTQLLKQTYISHCFFVQRSPKAPDTENLRGNVKYCNNPVVYWNMQAGPSVSNSTKYRRSITAN